jgi:hypothetical protein
MIASSGAPGNAGTPPPILDRIHGQPEADRIRAELERQRNRERLRARVGLYGPARQRRGRRCPDRRDPANCIAPTFEEQYRRAVGPRPAPSMSQAEFRRFLGYLLAHPEDARAMDRVLKADAAGGGR